MEYVSPQARLSNSRAQGCAPATFRRVPLLIVGLSFMHRLYLVRRYRFWFTVACVCCFQAQFCGQSGPLALTRQYRCDLAVGHARSVIVLL